MPISRQGQFLQADYFNNVGGMNVSDSLWTITEQQSTGGSNFEYALTGGIRKRRGLDKINSSADSNLRTQCMSIREDKDGTKTTLRAAYPKLQAFTVSSGAFTNLTFDTTGASSTVFTSTDPVSHCSFGNASSDITWFAGGGVTLPVGVVSETKVTTNGTSVPTGSFTAVATGGGSGISLAAGTYKYAIAFRKTSTQAVSNAVLDVSVTTVGTNDYVALDFSSVSNIDTTLYDKILIYRSAISGVSGFTTGALVKTLDIGTSTYNDTGATDEDSSTLVPRAGSILLDYSTLPTGTYEYLTKYKRRLVTASESTLYISEVNLSEAWPVWNYFQIPTGGKITGLGIISYVTPTSATLDELLVIFKENELWVLTGDGTLDDSGIPDWSLKFIDTTGCSSHNSIVFANGYLYFWNRRGIFLWDGAGKPIYISRPIEPFWAVDGDLDLSKLDLCWGEFLKKQNTVVWQCSHKIYGEQKYALRLDLRLTLPSITQTSGERIIDGIFQPDTTEIALYHGNYQKPPGESEDNLYVGDDAGYVYKHYVDVNDSDAGVDFSYETAFLNQEGPSQRKVYYKVIAWVEKVGTGNITLDYWTDYRVSETDKSSTQAAISTGQNNTAALWDVAFWDVASWDDYNSQQTPIVFHLRSTSGNTQGDCIKLRFSQADVDQPVTISGFSILYAPVGEVK